ncbi:MAG: GldG family protein [Acidobacteriota bacterium]
MQRNDTNRESSGASSGVRKGLVKAGTLSAGVILAAALLVIVNYFGWKYYQRFDWTKSHYYTLSEKTRNVLSHLDKDINVVVFMRPGDPLYSDTRELLDRYTASSKRIHVRTIDPDKNLAEAQKLVDQYQVKSLNVVVFESGKDRRVVESADMADYDYSAMQMGGQARMTGFKGEQRFTGAIVELEESKKPKILFTTGHGEVPLHDNGSGRGLGQAQDLLGRDNFDLEEWSSLGQGGVPAGTDLLVVAGPTSGFIKPELDEFAAYLAGGGRMLVLLDPTLRAGGSGLVETNLGPWLAQYGVKVGDDIVIDPANPLPFFGADTIFVSNYADHPATRSLRQARVPSVLSLARSVGKGTPPAGFDVTELLKTSDKGWGETNLAKLDAVTKDPQDVPGPVSLAVAVQPVEKADEKKPEAAGADAKPAAATPAPAAAAAKMRLVVFGDSDFASNAQLANAGNATLLADTMNWLVERKQLLGIAAKTPEQIRLNLTAGQLSLIFWTVLLILPAGAVAAGISVYLRRRR